MQGAPYPGLTVAANHKNISDIKWNIMNQLTYTCDGFQDADGCLKESAAAREIVRPVAKIHLETMFGRYMQVVAAEEKAEDSYIKSTACLLYSQTENPRFSFFNKLMNTLSVEESTFARKQKVKAYLDHLAPSFKAPDEHLLDKMAELFENHEPNNATYYDCMDTHFDDLLSQESKAMILLLLKVGSDASKLGMGHWLKMSFKYTYDHLEAANGTLWKRFEDLERQMDVGMSSLFGKDGFTFASFEEYLDEVTKDTATAQELEKALPGIGDKKAQAIVEYREAYGYFNSVDQLANISGIGTKTVDKLRGLVEIDVPLEHELEKRSAD